MGDVRLFVEREDPGPDFVYRVYVASGIEGCPEITFSHAEFVEKGRIEHDDSPFKCKYMPNGEMRFAVQALDRGWYTITVASKWSEYTPHLWQQPHVHPFHDEHYVLMEGWLIEAVQRTLENHWTADLLHDCEQVVLAGEAHNILPGPNAVFGTWKTLRNIKKPNEPDRDMVENWRWQEAAGVHITTISSVESWADCNVSKMI